VRVTGHRFSRHIFIILTETEGAGWDITRRNLQMKKYYTMYFTIIACAILIAGFSSCNKESETNDYDPITNEDNTGIEIRMRNANNGGNYLYLLHVDSACYNGGYWFSKVYLGIDNSDNFIVYSNYSNSAQEVNSDCGIVCVGNVSNLGQINNIPNSGWANAVSVKPGCGYIIRIKNSEDSEEYYEFSQYCRYARVYVVEWMEGTNGGIIGAVIRYEDNWKIED